MNCNASNTAKLKHSFLLGINATLHSLISLNISSRSPIPKVCTSAPANTSLSRSCDITVGTMSSLRANSIKSRAPLRSLLSPIYIKPRLRYRLLGSFTGSNGTGVYTGLLGLRLLANTVRPMRQSVVSTTAFCALIQLSSK